jgi:3-methylfumaryl-CoA hydratase
VRRLTFAPSYAWPRPPEKAARSEACAFCQFPLWHWLYFLPLHLAKRDRARRPRHGRGGFLPPVPLPRRMWAGSQFEFRAAAARGRCGERAPAPSPTSAHKQGRTGTLVFVKVRHEVRCNGAADPALVEFHDIVYRDAGARRPGAAAPGGTRRRAWQREIVPDDVLLFRYSALTFNGHRIHYDRRYVTEVEGYPGLIVHGPLIATLLMDLLRRELPRPTWPRFRFKAVRPTFDGIRSASAAGATGAGAAVGAGP